MWFVKILIILASVLLMAVPFVMEYLQFRRDKKNKISFKRFRLVVFSVVYMIAVTIILFFLEGAVEILEKLSQFIEVLSFLALKSSVSVISKAIITVVANIAIGMLFRTAEKAVRIGLKKKNLTEPKKNGEFNWAQKIERAVIKFFHNETWFFVAKILKYFNIILSAFYALFFLAYMATALFGTVWILDVVISAIFDAGYAYPTITLLVLWEMYFFLAGIEHIEEECPELAKEDSGDTKNIEIDIEAIDEEVRKQFKDFYACDVDISNAVQEKLSSADYHNITKLIAEAVENDKRNPQGRKELYLECVDKLVTSEKSLLINGGFFSEFSMYFLRYLSVIAARGDNMIFVCNTESQIDAVYDYLKTGLAEMSSLYCKGFQTDAVNFDHPIWRVVKISGEYDVIDEAAVDDNSILVTTLNYLCSTDFESQHSKFIHLTDTIVFVDSLDTVNGYTRQMATLNTRLKQITKNNAFLSKNGNINKGFKVRYMSRQVRYICFDDTRTPGLDKVLKNMLSVEFDSVDAMTYNPKTIVRCYNYEGCPDENGRRSCPQFFSTSEEIGAVLNMAVLCLAKGAANVTVFADGAIPYENIAETIASNMGQVSVKIDGNSIRINKHFYNPDEYSVVIAMDAGDNLPAAVRRYVSLVSDKPALVIVFSRPYMLRDYYIDNIASIWNSSQVSRIPVEEGVKKDIAKNILIKANAGGVSEDEIIRLASNVQQFDEFVKNRDINAILEEIIKIYGISDKDRIDLYKIFEYSSFRDFDENGIYKSEDKVLLRKQGKLFDMINGRDMVVMSTGEKDIILPVPRGRMTQNFIAGQNFLYDGNIYHIQQLDTATGKIYVGLATAGKNKEVYQYIQDREYRIVVPDEPVVHVYPSTHMILNRDDEGISVNDVYISVFKMPMEVVTRGYYVVDPHTLATNDDKAEYFSISDEGNEQLAKQTYRRYGHIEAPYYSSDSIMKDTDIVSNQDGAQMMTVRITGQFGSDINKTTLLATVMLNEILRSMFPSVADSIAVCPVLHGEISDEESKAILQKQYKTTIIGEHELFTSSSDLEFVIIEDSDVDLGVVSVLMTAGDNTLATLFTPIYEYLKWYSAAENKSNYLYYGLGHEPGCFDFEALRKLSKVLGDEGHDIKFVDMGDIVEYEICDFCGKRYAKGDKITVLDDGRKMCKDCAENLVGNNKEVLKDHLERAKIFLESTYGITLDDDYEFCFESTVKIVNTLKQNRNLVKRGSDIPLKAYVDDKKKVHIEYEVPSVNLSELLVRELTYVWQLKHIPEVVEELAEGHLALVAIQYLKFLNQSSLASIRTNYYESTGNISGQGYRRLVRELLANPQYSNNPFRYLLKICGNGDDEQITPPRQDVQEIGDLGLPYTPEKQDRVLDGNVTYFYYSQLAEFQKVAYDNIVEAIEKHMEQVMVDGVSFEEVCKIVDAIRYDRPELFYFKTFSMSGNTVKLHYGATAAEAETLKKRIEQEIPKYLDTVNDSMSAYDAAIRIHAKVISMVDYDTVALDKQKREGGPAEDKIDYLRTICGVFLEGKAVCEGYARAMQYLLQKCGIECAEVAGNIHKESGEEGGAHAWNILRLDGDYYYLDTTWDDSSNTVQTVKSNEPGFDYFCITTEELRRTRETDLCPVQMPVCTATRCNYFYHNNLVLDSYDLNKITEIAQAAAKSEAKSFTFKCKTKEVFDEALDKMCAVGKDCYTVLKAAGKINKKIAVNTYSYTYDKNIWTITVKFKAKK